MPLLLDTDYAALKERGLSYVEDEVHRFLVLRNFPLPETLYHEKACDVLVVIPQNYNQAGIDMFWTHPHLTRLDGKAIPKMNKSGGGDNRTFDGKEFCRWSRHWRHPSVQWRAGKDNADTILARIVWALNNPNADK